MRTLYHLAVAVTITTAHSLSSTPALAQWQANGTPVCTAAGNQLSPRSCPDGRGGMFLAWYDPRTNVDVYVQHVLNKGSVDPAWPANGLGVGIGTGAQGTFYDTPVIVSDGSGGAIVVWLGSNTAPYEVVAQRVTSTGGIATGWPAGGKVLSNSNRPKVQFSIATDAAGGAYVAWAEDMTLAPNGDGQDIVLQRVATDGTIPSGWPANGHVVGGAPHRQELPFVANDGLGNAIVAWTDGRNNPCNSPCTPDDGDIYAQRATPAGALTWTTNGTVICNVAPQPQYRPHVVADGAGGAYIAWNDARSTIFDVYLKRINSSGATVSPWLANGNAVGSAPGRQLIGSLALDKSLAVLVAWEDERSDASGDIYVQRVLPSGSLPAGWTANGVAVCNVAASSQRGPRIVEDGGDGLLVAWNDQRGNDIYAQRLLANATVASGWVANGTAVTSASGGQYGVVALPDGRAGILLAWEDLRSGGGDIYAGRVNFNGVATLPTEWVTDGAALYNGPQLTGVRATMPDNAGGSFVVFFDNRAGGLESDLFLQHFGADGFPVPGWPLSAVPLVTAPGFAQDVTMTTDGSGGAIITWIDTRNNPDGSDIYAIRITSAGARADGWLANGTAICTAPGYQTEPAIASDGAGGAIILWGDARSGNYYTHDIYGQRINGAGVIQWAANGIQVTSASNSEGAPRVIADGSGGVMFSMLQWPGDQVGAQRINGSGTRLWGTHGVSLGSGWQNDVVSDGAGGMFITFSRNNDLYVQRLNSSGAVVSGWPGSGLALCTAAQSQGISYRGSVAADGAGGLLVTWADRRADAGDQVNDIYASRVTGAGAIAQGWPANGLALCTAVGNQTDPQIVSNGAGGAIVSWTDGRGNPGCLYGLCGQDVYASHVLGTGALDLTFPQNGRAISTASGSQNFSALEFLSSGSAIAIWSDSRHAGSCNCHSETVAMRIDVDVVAPSQISTFYGQDGCDATHLFWVVTGDDGTVGTASAYDLRYATYNINSEALFAGATPISLAPPGPPGTFHGYDHPIGQCMPTHYYAIKIRDEAGNWSPLSPVASALTICLGPNQFCAEDANVPIGAVTLEFRPPAPNPTSGRTSFEYSIPSTAAGMDFELGIFDISGRRVATPAFGKAEPGHHSATWDLVARSGDRVPEGIYFARFRVGDREMKRTFIVRP